MKQVVCNASPLITLAKGGLLDVLRDQFGKIVCPQAVADEILAGPPEDIMRRVLHNLSWLERVRLDPQVSPGRIPCFLRNRCALPDYGTIPRTVEALSFVGAASSRDGFPIASGRGWKPLLRPNPKVVISPVRSINPSRLEAWERSMVSTLQLQGPKEAQLVKNGECAQTFSPDEAGNICTSSVTTASVDARGVNATAYAFFGQTQSSNDGIPDAWAYTYNLNWYDPNLANESPENDGVTNMDAYSWDENPWNPNDAPPASGPALSTFAAILLATAALGMILWVRRKANA